MRIKSMERERRTGKRRTAKRVVGAISCAIAVGSTTSCLSAFGETSYSAPPAYAPDFPCDPKVETSGQPLIDQQKFADACIGDRMGKVALVVYDDIPADQIDRTIDQTKQLIENSYDGLLHADIVPVAASEDASRSYHTWTDLMGGCVNDVNEFTYGSKIADQNMDLHGYTHVISISKQPFCSDIRTLGITPNNGSNGSRISDIVSAPDVLQILHGMPPEAIDSYSIAHEYGHMQGGFGHAGELNYTEYLGGPPLTNPVLPDDLRLDIPGYVKQMGGGLEYNDQANIMGNSYNTNLYLNGLQRRQVEWPERVKGEHADPKRVFNGGQTFIENPTTPEHTFAAYNLARPAEVSSSIDVGSNGKMLTYDTLVFEPVFDDNGQTPFVHVYLALAKDATSLSIGNIDMRMSTVPRTFTIDGQTIEFTATPDGFTVRDATLPK